MSWDCLYAGPGSDPQDCCDHLFMQARAALAPCPGVGRGECQRLAVN